MNNDILARVCLSAAPAIIATILSPLLLFLEFVKNSIIAAIAGAYGRGVQKKS